MLYSVHLPPYESLARVYRVLWIQSGFPADHPDAIRIKDLTQNAGLDINSI